MLRKSPAFGFLALMAGTVSALAQGDPTAMAHDSAANQLGALEYCQAQGHVGLEAVTAEQAVIAHIPSSQANTDAAEALGKHGSISVNGNSMTLASMASTHNTTVAALCQQMGSAAVQGAAAYSQNRAAAGMPTMPNMSGMPAMPGGMATMPTMPTAPSGR